MILMLKNDKFQNLYFENLYLGSGQPQFPFSSFCFPLSKCEALASYFNADAIFTSVTCRGWGLFPTYPISSSIRSCHSTKRRKEEKRRKMFEKLAITAPT